MNGLDLFSGIGGISFALAPWVRTVAYCEQDRYCQAVLLSRMQDGSIDNAPMWDDVRTLDAEELSSLSHPINIIFGGFPCQDISIAGNGIGLEGKRSGLFFEIIRLTRELRPRFIFLENVAAITTRGLDRVLMEFSALRYDCRWTIVSAAEMGAPHLRERWFLLAHSDGVGLRDKQISQPECDGPAAASNNGQKRIVADPNGSRELQQAKTRNVIRDRTSDSGQAVANAEGQGLQIPAVDSFRKSAFAGLEHGRLFGGKPPSDWSIEPDVGRVVNGLPHRVDRIRGLGNSVVPLQARTAFERLLRLSS